MSFASKAGCPMCGIVSTAQPVPPNSPRTPSFPPGSKQPEVLWRDENFTAYREKANPISSKGHIIIAFNLHVPSIYTLSASDLPLLVHIKSLGQRLLSMLQTPSSPILPPIPPTPNTASTITPLSNGSTPPPPSSDISQFRIGFITPPFKDNKIPVTDHLHAHAYALPADLMGWWRGMAYGPLAWYSIDDLIAEIREETSNNRVKSGYASRRNAPIDMVPDAGVRHGNPDGKETTEASLSTPDIEAGERASTSTTSPRSSQASPPVSSRTQIPSLRLS
ncbi:hypothetical protein JAAARDRAFT_37866 [Jaapia argillacea MUCL 33604]|uniref:HIT domain-containing protein n=1 Tax=Jaapia argillacea MUCL 33604 TaxID=933084 RepID=A0A067PWP8_9AGAM|nr:hypothetical protein JAAARDRAFT_37866 [Jaapia argillacea MUCL 33604]